MDIPEGTQLARLPIDVIYVTQGEYGSFTHYAGSNQELAIDFAGWETGATTRLTRYPLYAPFDSEVISVYHEWAQVNWRNTVDVISVTGAVYPAGTIVYTMVHDYNYSRWSVGDTVSQGVLFHRTGNAGYSFNDHLHLQVIHASTHLWPTPVSRQISIYDFFDTSHCTVFNGYGYPWKTFDGDVPPWDPGDPGDPGEPGDDDDDDDLIHLWLSDALNGWKY